MTTHNIYVIELDKEVLEKKRFKEANPDYIEGNPCVYVGMTSKSPEERFKQHKEGYRASRIVKKFGVRLKPRQYESHNPMSRDEASEMEFEKARRLRKKGWVFGLIEDEIFLSVGVYELCLQHQTLDCLSKNQNHRIGDAFTAI
jgi:predicted GIY-YIG superfamily endonuclease|tara:strand:+ start:1611 stop:2042 length:432 start_codon:yes stop_codon:yes gene_type:complete